jgi:hypothetical protein
MHFEFHTVQKLCLNFITSNIKTNIFSKFGIGNGKTLLCTALAVYLVSTEKVPVFVVSKNDHLILRDHKRFEKMLTSMDLHSAVNLCTEEPGIFYYSQRKLEAQFLTEDFMPIWRKAIVVLDEYDWVLLDGSVDTMASTLVAFSEASRVFGFSGSTLSSHELKNINSVFKPLMVEYPTMVKLERETKTHVPDELIATNLEQFKARLLSIAST